MCRATENQWFDRKSVRISPVKLAETEVAFANAEGGTVVVGLSSGQVEGTDAYPAHRNDLMQAAVDHTVPPVRARSRLLECINSNGDSDHLLIIEVDPSEGVHSTRSDHVYLRVGDENRRLSFGQRQELLYDKGQAHFDGTSVKEAGIDDLDPDILADYAAAISHPEPERALFGRGLMTRSGHLTAAAYLLFGRYPQDLFPAAHVRVLRYQGTTREAGRRQLLVEDLRFDGPIPRVLGETIAAVRRLEPTRRVLGDNSVFERQSLIPQDAWLEGIVNAVVHRSYSLGGDHIRVEVFNDRMEIESPGRFPGLVNLTDPRGVVRFARNPRIARVCADLHFGQELGEGIRRMFEEMRARGLAEPLYSQTSGTVRLTLSALMVDPRMADQLPPQYLAIIDIIRQGTALSTGDIADALGVTKPTMLRRLNALKNVGLIDWVGKSAKDPRAYWRLHSE
ncbi:ArsR family transcriptional regulator [Planosporangium thailandense]|uniref:ArsR family transcriptional regulator n=1 Tax=Planosporangium thailandense TaxID=765197 RepID=A0ABX0XT69_9ACTN|nr:ATP-binding protein [Planosporangium thailandense]NJC69011.1 ArsR family transcriptional regulator [Planosporangium thailandense]